MMWFGYCDGWSWLLMVLFRGDIAALIAFVARTLDWAERRDHAMNMLRRRLASGEITQEEFERPRRAMG